MEDRQHDTDSIEDVTSSVTVHHSGVNQDIDDMREPERVDQTEHKTLNEQLKAGQLVKAAETPQERAVGDEQFEDAVTETRVYSRRRPWYVQTIRFLFHLLWLPALSVACIIGGLIIGYTLIGGQPVEEIFSRELWQHLYDLVYLDN